MRASFVFSEVVTGLRRNITMTIAMILTTAISLGLLGGGLLIVRMIDRMQAIYYDRVEVNIYLTNDISANDPICAQSTCAALRQALENTSGVQSVVFESRNVAYQRFKTIFESQPELVQLARPESLPASFQVKLSDPQRFDVIKKEFDGKAGVQRIYDQTTLLRRLFNVLNGLRNATFAVALVQAFAALLLISNTIQISAQISAYTRRAEVSIMRLVGATRWYTQLPFLIEAVVAGVVGALLAVTGLILAKVAFLDKVLEAPVDAGILPKLTFADVAYISPWLFLVGSGVAALTGYITLRLYVRL